MTTSENKNLVIERYVVNREKTLIEAYITDGPEKMKEDMGVTNEEWQLVFDHLVFSENLLYKSVMRNSDFFLDEYIKYGMAHVREIFNVSDSRYDRAFEVVFDLLAISNEGLYYHVLQHRDRYTVALKARGTDFVRKVLGVWKEKYEENWGKVLDVLLHATCDAIFSEQTFENGLRSFSMIMNGMREHRPIYKSGIIV